MVNTFVAVGLGALVALSPLAAIAQTDGAAQPMQVAQAAPNSAHAGGGGSHGRHLRHRGNTHKEQARAGAEHMRQMRMAPAAPKSDHRTRFIGWRPAPPIRKRSKSNARRLRPPKVVAGRPLGRVQGESLRGAKRRSNPGNVAPPYVPLDCFGSRSQ